MTRWEAKGYVSAAFATAAIIPYGVWAALNAEAARTNLDIAMAIVLIAAGPGVWMLAWKLAMRLMGERP